MSKNDLPWTGERLVTSIKNFGAIEHLHRYAFATEFVDNKIILDIASGEGYGSNLLSQKAKMVYGVDISKEAVAHSSKKYRNKNLKFIEGSVDRIPLKSSSIDVVVSFETLEHIVNQENMLLEIKRVLKEDGLLIMSTPERSNYQDKLLEKNHFHIKELYYSEFEMLMDKHFAYNLFFKQKFLSGSLIASFGQSRSLNIYYGDYNNITKSETIEDQTFNICIASNTIIQYQTGSLFDLGNFESNISDNFIKKEDQVPVSQTNILRKLLALTRRIIKTFLK
jgi:ubiquinone/menaquinone biosynthesis C-methylase UbiE